MTAYGRSVLATSVGRFVIELHSVNRKFLEISTYLPKSLIRFDSKIKKWIAEKVSRGQVNVRIGFVPNDGAISAIIPNIVLAKQIKAAWDQIAVELKLPIETFPLSLLAAEEGIIQQKEELADEQQVLSQLHHALLEALKQLIQMKSCEGQALFTDLETRLKLLKISIDFIENLSPESVVKYREKLKLKIEEMLPAAMSLDGDDRLLKEVCFFAEKVDVAEEITRFNSHIQQFFTVMQRQEGGHGKTLEFIIQELFREANTIGSKSADHAITKVVIEIKTELERMREQIQNVE